MRAQRKRGGARGIGSDSELESGSVGEEDAPDRRGPPGGESGRGRGRWAGWAKRRGNGPAGKKLLGCGVKKKKAEMGWAERGLGERKKSFPFSKMIQTLSN